MRIDQTQTNAPYFSVSPNSVLHKSGIDKIIKTDNNNNNYCYYNNDDAMVFNS